MKSHRYPMKSYEITMKPPFLTHEPTISAVAKPPGATTAPSALVFCALRRAVAWHLRERLKGGSFAREI